MISEELRVVVRAEAAQAIKELNNVKTATTGGTMAFKQMAQALVGFGGATAALVAFKRVVVDTISSSVRLAAQMQQQATAFKVLLGSAEEAGALMRDIQDFSARTPFMFAQLAEVTQVLIATGTAAGDVTRVLGNLGNASIGNSEKLARLADAYSKLQTKGRASLEEINRFTEAGVPLLDALQEQYGMTRDELFKYIETGRVGFEEVDKALQRLTEGEGMFAGMMEEQSRTLSGAFSTLKDEMDLLKVAMAESFVDPLTDAVGIMTKFIALMREAKNEANLQSSLSKNITSTRDPGFFSLPRDEMRRIIVDTIAGYEAMLKNTPTAGVAGDVPQWVASQTSEDRRIEAEVATLRGLLRGLDAQDRYAPVLQAAIRDMSDLVASLPNYIDTSARAQAIAIRQTFMKGMGITDINQVATAFPELQSLINQIWWHDPKQAGNGIPFAALYGMGISPSAIDASNLVGGNRLGLQGTLYTGTTVGGTPGAPDFNEVAAAMGIGERGAGLSAFGDEGFTDPATMERINAIAAAFDAAKASAFNLDMAIADLGDSLQALSLEAVTDAAFQFGKALAETGDFAGSAMDAVASFWRTIIDSLPQMLLAGAANAAATGNFPLAAGLLAASAAAAVVSGMIAGSESPKTTSSVSTAPVINVYGDINDADRFESKVMNIMRSAGSPA